MSIKVLRLILGDQLNQNHSWYKDKSEDVIYVMMEVRQETDYVCHHIQKVVAFFAAMRNYAEWLRERGMKIIYLSLDDEKNQQNISDNLSALISRHGIEKFEYQLPDEYRLDQQLRKFCAALEIPSQPYDTEHFYTGRDELKTFFEEKQSKSWLMESFYRHMRKKHGILLEEKEEPIGGKWNFDQSNRKSLPKDHQVIHPRLFQQNVSKLLKMIKENGVKTIGEIQEDKFIWPLSREDSLRLLNYFLENCLTHFGDYQDAMDLDEWSLYHSRLSFSLNSKMISPSEVIAKAIQHWEENKDEINISQLEGFIRQILGWREYMRGIYWAKMPDYENENQLNHRRALPKFYWNGNTKMKCMQKSIGQSLKYAYAHHIQRLMITGNFALLANINPREVDEWYLGIYIDAIQWVELPNTRGMSQYADGGLIATKPYTSSANYINKMSNYCKSCHYSKSKKTGDEACPFNSLYWNFIDRHQDLWEENQRMSMMVSSWKQKAPHEKEALLKQADIYLRKIEDL